MKVALSTVLSHGIKHKDDKEEAKIAREEDDEDKELGQSNDHDEEFSKQAAILVRERQAVSHCFNLETLLRKRLSTDDLNKMIASFKGIQNRVRIIDQMCQLKTQQEATVPVGPMAKYKTGVDWLKGRQSPVFGGIFEWNVILHLVSNEHKLRKAVCGCCQLEIQWRACKLENVQRLLLY